MRMTLNLRVFLVRKQQLLIKPGYGSSCFTAAVERTPGDQRVVVTPIIGKVTKPGHQKIYTTDIGSVAESFIKRGRSI